MIRKETLSKTLEGLQNVKRLNDYTYVGMTHNGYVIVDYQTETQFTVNFITYGLIETINEYKAL